MGLARLSMSTILTVSQLTNTIKHAVEQALPYAWVRGEVTNLSHAASGHIYFSLRENDALLKCIWFNSLQNQQERFDPLTGEVFEDGARQSVAASLQNGQHVVAAGAVTIYPQQGVYQLRVERMMPEGEGAYHLAFEESRRKLESLGYFDVERKRPLPKNPSRVLVVTSTHGATIHDFIRVAENRGTGSTIRIMPCLVQGEHAPAQICETLATAYSLDWAELIVLIRGGGSLEDLAAFNDFELAKMIAKAPIPVITGIGHEPDVSIADMVADVRAATPSHAAQLIWPERAHLATALHTQSTLLHRSAKYIVANHVQRFTMTQRALHWFSPLANLQRLAQTQTALKARLHQWAQHATRQAQEKHNTLNHRLHTNIAYKLERSQQALTLLRTSLEGGNPLAPLARGYSLTHDAEGRVIRSIQDVANNAAIHIRMHDGSIDAIVTNTSKQTS